MSKIEATSYFNNRLTIQMNGKRVGKERKWPGMVVIGQKNISHESLTFSSVNLTFFWLMAEKLQKTIRNGLKNFSNDSFDIYNENFDYFDVF